ncbi:MAG: 3-hydroxyisobutyrate dehydrogenase [Pseudomonadota bacterium]
MVNVSMIGLGNMGSGMCHNLVKAGYNVTAFDLSTDAISRACEKGATAAASIEDCVKKADAIVTMLPAGKHVLQVYFGDDGVANHAPVGTVFIDCSTIAVEDARKANSFAHQSGFTMIDAPVSGGVAAAEAGTLTFMVGGTKATFDKASPFLNSMGKTIVHAGAAGNGQVAKIANNMLLGISMLATCEAFHLASELGLDAQTFFDISSKASGQNWSMTSYCPAPGPVATAPSNNDYEPGFAVDMMLKDLHLASAAAKSSDVLTDLGERTTSIYESLSKKGFGQKDFSIIMKHVSRNLNS